MSGRFHFGLIPGSGNCATRYDQVYGRLQWLAAM